MKSQYSQNMARLFMAVNILLISILLLAGGGKTESVVDGARCKEALGECGTDCPQRCNSAHAGKNPEGNCDQSVTPATCMCNYDCGPPQRKCTRGIGFCSSKCNVGCCNQTCAGRFEQGIGYCLLLAGIWECQC